MFYILNSLETGDLMTTSIQSFVHDLYSIINNISSRFSSNFEANASKLLAILKEIFPLCYKHKVICLTSSNLQPHTGMASATRG